MSLGDLQGTWTALNRTFEISEKLVNFSQPLNLNKDTETAKLKFENGGGFESDPPMETFTNVKLKNSSRMAQKTDAKKGSRSRDCFEFYHRGGNGVGFGGEI
eukprot:TRINITY_DN5929_c0_g1_i1.p1 TRINITY_DN5929_c0_g1~~TRINITY_DN5929_c0_g1_i1.p1  ORF type:complete len:102 (-),score=17.22 TRINITY_DN5929_c0_g1_i1:708-1013(-)